MRHRGIHVSSKPVLGYWRIRGLAANIRYQLKYCGVDFDQQFYYGMDDWFKGDKIKLGLEFPNIPYFIHGEHKITETLAIHHYIAEVWDSTLLGKTTKDKAVVSMLNSKIAEIRWKVVPLCYRQDDRNVAIQEYNKHLPALIEFLGSK